MAAQRFTIHWVGHDGGEYVHRNARDLEVRGDGFLRYTIATDRHVMPLDRVLYWIEVGP